MAQMGANHEDMIVSPTKLFTTIEYRTLTIHDTYQHDAVLNYYGNRLATCSSDKTIKIFEIEGNNHNLVETLRGLVRFIQLYLRILLGKRDRVERT